MKYQIVVSSTNMMSLLPRCLVGVDMQQHKDFDVTVVDNGSTDKEVIDFSAAFCKRKLWNFISLPNKVSEKDSFYTGINFDCPDDVVVFLHGSDRLIDGGALIRLDSIYDHETQVTFGGAIPCPDVKDFCYPTRTRVGNLFTALSGALAENVSSDDNLVDAMRELCGSSQVKFVDEAIYLESTNVGN